MPILAQMSREDGSRFGSLVRVVGLSRSVLSRHLDVLEGFGWIVRNPGHGHPLRPEYLLTEDGRRIASWSSRVMRTRQRLGLERDALGRWSLPVVRRLDPAPLRFSQLESALKPITPRALSLELGSLCRGALVEQRAPGPTYRLTDRGAHLAAAAG